MRIIDTSEKIVVSQYVIVSLSGNPPKPGPIPPSPRGENIIIRKAIGIKYFTNLNHERKISSPKVSKIREKTKMAADRKIINKAMPSPVRDAQTSPNGE